MAIYFLDTSVFFRAYAPDEERHDDAVRLLTSGERLVGSELLRVEAAAAVEAAERAGRFSPDDASELHSLMEADTGPNGIVELLDFAGPATLGRARGLVVDHAVATLGALHLAVADLEGRRLAGWIDFYNRRRPHGALSHKPPLARLNELNNLPGSYI